MSTPLRLVLAALGAFLLLYTAAATYWLIAPKLLGPEKAVTALCRTITPGISTAAFAALLQQNPSFVVTPLYQGEQSVSKYTGNWMCTCGVSLKGDQVDTVKDVICVD